MDFGRRRTGGAGGAGGAGDERRVSALTLYADPPHTAVALADFESLAVERLKVLSVVEHSSSRGEPLDRTLRRLDEALRGTHMAVRSEEERAQDNLSHWVLRLAFAATQDMRSRFLNFEMLLFRYRFEKRLDMAEVQRFMRDNDLTCEPIARKEHDLHADKLRDLHLATRGRRQQQIPKPFESVQHFKVPFTQVCDLVGRRAVLVHKGFAFVPETELVSVLLSRFRANLSQKLAFAFRSLPYVRQEERIRPILKMLETAYVGPEFGKEGDKSALGTQVRAENLDQFARSFPLCMREMHAALKSEHHLKYHARLQFQRFLKGIGLSMADCLRYFQVEFAKRPTSAEVFGKKYAYSIRHTYGQEGSRKDYRPYSCMQIITGVQPASAAEHHGCPFRSYNSAKLRRALTKQMGAAQMQGINEIMDAVETKKHYQLACRRHFELTHPGASSGKVGEHPNAWFEESAKHCEANATADPPASSAAASQPPPQPQDAGPPPAAQAASQ